MTSRLAVIIPNYNGASFIRTTVAQFAGSFPAATILVIDDASTDRSLKVLEGGSATVLKRDRNGGFAAAVNTGLRTISATGHSFSLVANSDLEMTPAQAEAILSAIEVEFADESVGALGFLEHGTSDPGKFVAGNISGFLFCLRREVVARVGYLDESFFMYGEEQDYFRRLLGAGFRIVQTGIVVGHPGEGSGQGRIRNSWLAIRNALRLELKHREVLGFARVSIVLFLIVNRLRRSREGHDPSMARIRRPGVLLGNLFLLGALAWNFVMYFPLALSSYEHKPDL